MNPLVGVSCVETDDFEVQFEILPVKPLDEREQTIYNGVAGADKDLRELESKLEEYNKEIDRLTNHADSLDYTVAVASGVLTGLLDAFAVGEIDLKSSREWGDEKVNSFIKKVAGEKGKDDKALDRAIKKLADKSKPYFPSDPNLNDFGGGRQHHLRDFAHHPTPTGLLFSILTQFTKNCYGTDTLGKFIVVPVKDLTRIGDTAPKKIVYATIYWFIHLVSDLAGTGEFVGKGTGLPGPILSLAKELSVLPPFNHMRIHDNDTELSLSQLISKIFNGTLFADHDESGKIIKESVVNVDLRTELGIIKTQAWPVLLNELIVRVFYSIRRLILELNEHPVETIKDLQQLDWRKIMPFKNRTLSRMLTIATGTFTAVDLADAAIHSAIKSGGVTNPAFFSNMILRVNFVGIGRFALAVSTDVSMGIQKELVKNKRGQVISEMICLSNTKLYYVSADYMCEYSKLFEKEGEMHSAEADLWIQYSDTQQAMDELSVQIEKVAQLFINGIKEYYNRINSISKSIEAIEKKS